MSDQEFSYDTRCEELAAVFLEEMPEGIEKVRRTKELAQVIQNAIENWMVYQETNSPPF